MKKLAGALAFAASLIAVQAANAQEKTEFSVCWSIYAGWMPWGYLEESGIMDKWAEKYGIDVEIVQINDYIESINQYTAGEYDACTMTNMDALSIPSAGGVDTTVLIAGDYSNGNDGLVLKSGTELADIEGQSVNLVELSVSHYFLARALESVGLSERDITTVNTSDADMVSIYGTPEVTAVATWNPMLSEILSGPDANLVFDSSKIPGEIIDMLVVNTETLNDNPDFGKALVGAWFEVLALMQSDTPEGTAALEAMAAAAGTDLEGYKSQLAATALFYTPEELLEFTTGDKLPQTTKFVAEFLYDHGILGQGAPSPEFVGVSFPDGSTYGDENNVKLRYDNSYVEMARDGEL
ncbi:putative urea ABC transporter substrate-binding protein [Jiella marina]|uniref:putative urea ABC transporter substrate-binding protein n=1 Tax=Jiella sp. LLJ827 TaxID=2917712 RepID=UPI002100DC33|nr:putative urea ABC transporter substrate-binding protein [Jiella sp. LLJ827]MCQ0987465.1 putative urea ABC transporter substrate-binding protein [Jiella sp. LLJ827]